MLLRNPCKNLKSYHNPFWKNSDGGEREKRKERKKEEEKKSMIIVVPSCLKDADGARTRSDQNSAIFRYIWAYSGIFRKIPEYLGIFRHNECIQAYSAIF